MAGPSVELLQRIPLFAGLEPRELARLSESFKERTFSAGEPVATEGEGGAGFFVIESGEASVTVHGDERAASARATTSATSRMIDQGDRTASIKAESDLKCYGLTFWDFRPIVEQGAGDQPGATSPPGSPAVAATPTSSAIVSGLAHSSTGRRPRRDRPPVDERRHRGGDEEGSRDRHGSAL